MTRRIRVYELARELGLDTKVLISRLNEMGIQVRNHMTALDEKLAQNVRRKLSGADKQDGSPERHPRAEEAQAAKAREAQRRGRRGSRRGTGKGSRQTEGSGRKQARPEIGARRVVIQGDTPVRELATLIGVPVANVLRAIMSFGKLISINQDVPVDLAVKVAEKLGCVVTVKEPEKSIEEQIALELDRPDDPEKSEPRPPVVTVMGHVDHGKTSLLDAIRNTNVTAREAGGITQHIGASVVEHEGNKIIFLDTPGHEAFTQMRARGARVTDVAVLVVAADDGVMPQTIEAANHAKAADVPVIVALNKIDKPSANPQRVKQQLAEIGLIPEEWGGDTVVVEVSAKTREGIDDLLEMIVLVAELQELKADPTRSARGYIIESEMDKGRGPVASAIIRSGVLEVGQVIVTDTTWGRIRAMFDGRGRQVQKAGPSTPVEIIGLEELPQAGDTFLVVPDEKIAKEVTEQRKIQRREQELATSRMTLQDFLKKQEDEKRELRLILKSDVQGSLEAILQALGKMDTDEVEIKVLHSGVGAVIESDIMLAKASDARVLGFNVRPDANARNVAEAEGVEIRTYRIIYELLEDVEQMVKGLTKPKFEEVVLGRVEVRATFRVPNVGTVAGCYVTSGKVTRNASVRLLRDGRIVYEGKIASLKRFKDDVTEVAQGYECGIGLERYQDIKPGDVLEVYTMEEVKPA
ncbi:MAG TPA: translation initiation factor IF-2 [Bacillota bacterium]|nr:translation initiation factor IF-2 [Candidatus Fermentithermobacillaceae bacterium]HOA70776.1 translation initiation factor IF-2 [Bacillota bacterium]HOP70800.1 translation initiation factor IF-2 [Bacillota bacterium]HPT35710.1 translation initiation factor IF-2 [Bacillota bacterium]HPZ85069.1 translation initiation factor IF-2 [Bacillota bacterium]